MLIYKIEEILLQVVKDRKTITYSQLAREINKTFDKKIPEKGKGLSILGRYLFKLCEKYTKQGKPMIGAVVVNKTKGVPSEGFFKNAEKLYNIKISSEEEKLKFWKNEIEKLYKEFGD